jgi:hypothetical protein
MLLIFAFSSTPKIFLHNLVVHHKDSNISLGKYAQVSTTGFHCDCESQVVELPYLNQVFHINLLVLGSFQIYQSRTNHQFFSFPHYIFGLRGPPLSA